MKRDGAESLGFQPVDGLDPAISKRRGRCLPHWSRDGATYFVTWRLTGSIPRSVLKQYEEERVALDRLIESGDETAQLRKSALFTERVDAMLDKGHGECLLSDSRAARIMVDSLMHFNGERYKLYAYAVMPNHVHVLVHPRDDYKLSDVVHSWKSFSSNRINALLGRGGALWQSEYFDHLVRDVENFARIG